MRLIAACCLWSWNILLCTRRTMVLTVVWDYKNLDGCIKTVVCIMMMCIAKKSAQAAISMGFVALRGLWIVSWKINCSCQWGTKLTSAKALFPFFDRKRFPTGQRDQLHVPSHAKLLWQLTTCRTGTAWYILYCNQLQVFLPNYSEIQKLPHPILGCLSFFKVCLFELPNRENFYKHRFSHQENAAVKKMALLTVEWVCV